MEISESWWKLTVQLNRYEFRSSNCRLASSIQRIQISLDRRVLSFANISSRLISTWWKTWARRRFASLGAALVQVHRQLVKGHWGWKICLAEQNLGRWKTFANQWKTTAVCVSSTQVKTYRCFFEDVECFWKHRPSVRMHQSGFVGIGLVSFIQCDQFPLVKIIEDQRPISGRTLLLFVDDKLNLIQSIVCGDTSILSN